MDGLTFKEVLTGIKEFSKYSIHMVSIIGIFYFLPLDLVLFPIPTEYQFWVKISIIFCFIYTGGVILEKISQLLKKWNLKKQNQRSLKRVLSALDNYEKDVLCKFYDQKRSTINLDFRDAVVQGLLHKKVLINVTLTGNAYQIDSYLSSIIDPEQDLNLSDFIERKDQNKLYYYE